MKLIIGFSKPKKFKPFAWIIMKLWNSNFDHVYTRLYLEEYNKELIFQASGLCINFENPNIFLDNYSVVEEYEVELNLENYSKVLNFAMDNVGKKYGVKEAIGIGLKKIFNMENPFKDGTKTFVCSTLVDYILEEYSNLVIPGDFEDESPQDLRDFLAKNFKRIT